MKVALIPPIRALHLYDDQTYHLVLAHLLEEPTYREYYRSRVLRGDHVILDNSAHELGAGLSPAQLAHYCSLLRPAELILPDRLFFGEDTYRDSELCLGMIQGCFANSTYSPLYMACPQGRSIEEWSWCAEKFYNLGIRSFGISKDYEVWDGGLANLCQKVPLDSTIHLLGWGRNPLSLAQCAGIPNVRGVDSAKPFVYAQAGIKLPELVDCVLVDRSHLWDHSRKIENWPEYPRRQTYYFNSNDHNLELYDHNIRIFKEFANGVKSRQTLC